MRKFTAIVAALALTLGVAAATTAPASAASKPTLNGISNTKPLPAGGQTIILYGTGLSQVTEVLIDTTSATILVKTASQLSFTTPAHSAGGAALTLVYPGGKVTFSNAISYKTGFGRVLVPLPYFPSTLGVKKTFTVAQADSNWDYKLTTTTPKICSIKGLVVTGVRKGNCDLTVVITLDSNDPNYRGRSVNTDITVK